MNLSNFQDINLHDETLTASRRIRVWEIQSTDFENLKLVDSLEYKTY